jgi:hypothetical protein
VLHGDNGLCGPSSVAGRRRVTGKVTTLLCQAAELAIRQKTECISADFINHAATDGIYKYLTKEDKT